MNLMRTSSALFHGGLLVLAVAVAARLHYAEPLALVGWWTLAAAFVGQLRVRARHPGVGVTQTVGEIHGVMKAAPALRPELLHTLEIAAFCAGVLTWTWGTFRTVPYPHFWG